MMANREIGAALIIVYIMINLENRNILHTNDIDSLYSGVFTSTIAFGRVTDVLISVTRYLFYHFPLKTGIFLFFSEGRPENQRTPKQSFFGLFCSLNSLILCGVGVPSPNEKLICHRKPV